MNMKEVKRLIALDYYDFCREVQELSFPEKKEVYLGTSKALTREFSQGSYKPSRRLMRRHMRLRSQMEAELFDWYLKLDLTEYNGLEEIN